MIQRRRDLLKIYAGKTNTFKGDFSFSAVMRNLRRYNPEQVSKFLIAFKEAFDLAQLDNVSNCEPVALMQALQSLDEPIT